MSTDNAIYKQGIKIGIVEALGCLLDGHSISDKRQHIAESPMPEAPFESAHEMEDFKRGVDEALGVVEVWLHLRKEKTPRLQ